MTDIHECNVAGCTNQTTLGICHPCRNGITPEKRTENAQPGRRVRVGQEDERSSQNAATEAVSGSARTKPDRINAVIAQTRARLELPTKAERERREPKRKLLADMTPEERDAIGGCTCGASGRCDYCAQFH